jgi:DNA-binding MarR family transcriptional regulator
MAKLKYVVRLASEPPKNSHKSFIETFNQVKMFPRPIADIAKKRKLSKAMVYSQLKLMETMGLIKEVKRRR